MFTELFYEAITVVKKGNKQKSDRDYGTIGKRQVINTKHTSDKRYGVDRNDSMDIKRIKEVISKAVALSPKNGRYLVAYRDKKGTYGTISINIKKNVIEIVTIMDLNKKDYNKYHLIPDQEYIVVENEQRKVIFVEI